MSTDISRLLLLASILALLSSVSYADTDTSSVDTSIEWLEDNYIDNPSDFHSTALVTLQQTKKLADPHRMAEAHAWLMRWHAYHVPFTIDSIFHHGEQALSYYQIEDDRLSIARVSDELAFEYIDGDLDRSEELIFNSVDIYERLEDKSGLGDAFCTMAAIFLAQEEPELSIKYALQSLEYTEQTDDYSQQAHAYLWLMQAYEDVGQFKEAIDAGTRSIEILEEHVHDEVFNLARAYAYRGDVQTQIKNYSKGVADNEKAYKLIEEAIGAARPAAKTYRIGIGQGYYRMGKYEEAIPHLEAAIEGYTSMGQQHHPKMEPYYTDLAASYSATGDFRKAYLMEQRAHSVLDTLMQNRIANLEAESLVKYETAKKDQELLTQAQTIKQGKLIQWLSVGLISILVIFLGTLFYSFRKTRAIAQSLATKNAENELLLKEIHHRVKNNLQVISSLLSIQSRNLTDKQAKSAILSSQTRVQSMSLIHQKLYRGKELAAVEMKSYLNTLADNLIDAYADNDDIQVNIDMEEIELNVDYAIPLGLIVNELVTNSLKYAFPDGRDGTIDIKLKQGDKGLTLSVGDNGVGASAKSVPGANNGFGTKLVELLTEQLKGKLEKTTDEGHRTQLYFEAA